MVLTKINRLAVFWDSVRMSEDYCMLEVPIYRNFRRAIYYICSMHSRYAMHGSNKHV